jgi:DMSO/TMAO reductase YedYZ molybdopterin-dependent catalytic subunit
VARTIVTSQPLNASSDAEALWSPLTPASGFFVRNHFPIPDVDAGNWRLRLLDEKKTLGQWTLGQLKEMTQHEVTATLECAGNGRRRLNPKVAGVEWDELAVGTATWRGVRLRDLLPRSLDEQVRELVFEGADRGVEGGRSMGYERSLPVADAIADEVLVALQMNGQTLPREHGAPARLIVPGWYGVASVKWLKEIRLSRTPFEGWFQRDRYVYRQSASGRDGPVARLRLKSLILSPAAGETIGRGKQVEIKGIAWGSQGVDAVEVSVDGGANWHPARLLDSPSRERARRFLWEWVPARIGPASLVVRARDEQGHLQPEHDDWNLFGYGQNGWHRRAVTVRDA